MSTTALTTTPATSGSAPTTTVSTTSGSAPTTTVSTTSGSAPTTAVSTTSGSAPTTAVSTTSGSAPTTAVSTTSGSAPTTTVSTTSGSAPTTAVSTTSGSAPTTTVSTTSGSAPTTTGGSASTEIGDVKAKDYGNRVSLTAPQIIALDTLINRMQGWTDESLPGAGEDNTPAERIIPWISGHYGASIQGKTSSNPGYKVNFSGFSVGSDFIVNDEVKLGLSYSNITSKLRVKGNKNTDGTKSHTVSIYGQYNFTKDIFTQSAIAYTVGSSKNRPNNLNSYKVSSNGIGGFATLNKEFLLDSDISVTPRIGLRYIQSKEKDVNLGGGNKVKGAKNHYLTGIFGTTLSTKTELTDGTLLRPMLYAGLEKNFITKSNAPIARIEEAGRPFEHQNTTKPQKTSYILGTGLSAKRNNLILSVSYQSSIAKKYISHHGILKLGLAF
ncbi:autotransporter outer membrane beta-barrel domain-containing protein [Candidatus Phycorickettsia trachydisci]|nr:autotransporter outer membrane beta-barrel domain-containing protein [Candidatus Phycorickettsia trachydisci]